MAAGRDVKERGGRPLGEGKQRSPLVEDDEKSQRKKSGLTRRGNVRPAVVAVALGGGAGRNGEERDEKKEKSGGGARQGENIKKPEEKDRSGTHIHETLRGTKKKYARKNKNMGGDEGEKKGLKKSASSKTRGGGKLVRSKKGGRRAHRGEGKPKKS